MMANEKLSTTMMANQDWLEMEDPCGEGTVGMHLPEWSGCDGQSSQVDHATAVFQAQYFDLPLSQDDSDGSKQIRHKTRDPLDWINLFRGCLGLFNPIHCLLEPWKQQDSFQIVEGTSKIRRPSIETKVLLNISDWCEQGRRSSPTSIHDREKQEEASMYLVKNKHSSMNDHYYGVHPIGYQEFISIGYQEFVGFKQQ
jgi:hypothetical protein